MIMATGTVRSATSREKQLLGINIDWLRFEIFIVVVIIILNHEARESKHSGTFSMNGIFQQESNI